MRDLESELDLLDYEGGMLVGGKLCEIDIEGIISYYLAEHLPAPHFLLPVPSFLVCFSFLCGGFYLLSFLLLVSLDWLAGQFIWLISVHSVCVSDN